MRRWYIDIDAAAAACSAAADRIPGTSVSQPRFIYEEETVEQEVPSRFEQLWSVEQAAEYLAMSVKTLYGWRCRKYGPPSYRLGNKVRYRPEEVRSWVDEQNALAY